MRNNAIEEMRLLRRKAVAAVTRPTALAGYWLTVVAPEWPSWKVGRINIIDENQVADDSKVAVLNQAFGLVRQYAPWQFSLLERYLRSLVIVGEGATHFVPLLRVLTVRDGFLQEKYLERLAARLVSAAVEARLCSYGWWQRPELRQRLSRNSFEAAVAFARRLPDGLPLIEQLSSEWQSTGWMVWSVGDASQEALRRTGTPQWLARPLAWWLRLLDT